MDILIILRTFAAVTTVVAAALVVANLNARVTVIGFVIFIVASIAWMADGWVENKASLVNVLGVWRWLPKAEKEVEFQETGVNRKSRCKKVCRCPVHGQDRW